MADDRCDRTVYLKPTGDTHAADRNGIYAADNDVRGSHGRAAGTKVDLRTHDVHVAVPTETNTSVTSDSRTSRTKTPTRREALQSLQDHPALEPIIDRFAAANTDLYLVGGAIREAAAGRLGDRADLDCTTAARPDQIMGLVDGLGTVVETGKSFGTITVAIRRQDADGNPVVEDVEITTFRTERYDTDSRQPHVNYADTLDEDLRRRDFTVNTLAMSLTSGDLQVIDMFGGLQDLADGRLRTPDDPNSSFTDDPLRMLRMVRFAARAGWTIDQNVSEAARAHARRLQIVSQERRTAELLKTLKAPRRNTLSDALQIAANHQLTHGMFGQLNVEAVTPQQAQAVKTPTARLALLTAATSPQQRQAALQNLKLSTAEVSQAVHAADLVDLLHQQHVTDHTAPLLTKTADGRFAADGQPTDTPTVRALIRSCTDDVLDDALAVAAAHTPDTPPQAAVALATARQQSERWRQPLPVDGHDALQVGLQGPTIGKALGRVEAHLLTHGTIDKPTAMRLLRNTTAD